MPVPVQYCAGAGAVPVLSHAVLSAGGLCVLVPGCAMPADA